MPLISKKDDRIMVKTSFQKQGLIYFELKISEELVVRINEKKKNQRSSKYLITSEQYFLRIRYCIQKPVQLEIVRTQYFQKVKGITENSNHLSQ